MFILLFAILVMLRGGENKALMQVFAVSVRQLYLQAYNNLICGI